VMRVNDLINLVDKMDLYVNSSRIQLHIHQMGQPTSLARLLAHIGNLEPREEVADLCRCYAADRLSIRPFRKCL
jgi:hypothetical protein